MRRTLEEAGVGYVLAVPKSQQLHAPFGRIEQAIADAPDEAWERHSFDGAQGPRFYDWAAARLPSIGVFDGDQQAIARRCHYRRRTSSGNDFWLECYVRPEASSTSRSWERAVTPSLGKLR